MQYGFFSSAFHLGGRLRFHTVQVEGRRLTSQFRIFVARMGSTFSISSMPTNSRVPIVLQPDRDARVGPVTCSSGSSTERYFKMLTARAATTAMVINDTMDSEAKSALARKDNGMESAGAKLVPVAKDVKR